MCGKRVSFLSFDLDDLDDFDLLTPNPIFIAIDGSCATRSGLATRCHTVPHGAKHTKLQAPKAQPHAASTISVPQRFIIPR